jgi:hypothetical protein
METSRSLYYAYDNGQIHARVALTPTCAGGEKGWEGLRRGQKEIILHKPINLVSSRNYYNNFGLSDMPLVLDLLYFLKLLPRNSTAEVPRKVGTYSASREISYF